MPPRSLALFVGGLLVALALPAAVFPLLRLPDMAFDNFSDSAFYPAYARDFTEMILRQGFVYYAVRFGAIFPDALAYMLFGDPASIGILRVLLASATSVALYLFFSRHAGPPGGLAAALIWSVHPAAARLLSTTYLDSTGVPLLVLATCLLASGWRPKWVSFVAGVLLAMVASAHLHLAFAFLLLIPFLLGARWGEALRLARDALLALLGAAVAFASAWAFYQSVWRMPALFSPMIELLKGMASGDTEKWRRPLEEALLENPVWFSPFPLLLVFALRWKTSCPLERGTAISLAATTSFFWLGDLIGGAYALSMPFYFSFMLPAFGLGLATLAACVLREAPAGGARMASLAMVALMAFLLPFLAARADWPIGGLLAASACVVVLLGALAWKHKPIGLLPLLLVLAVSLLLALQSRFFGQFCGTYRSLHPKENAVLLLADSMRRSLPSAWEDGRSMRFWYDGSRVGLPRTLQFFYLHDFMRLQFGAEGVESPAGFPEWSPAHSEAAATRGVQLLVLLAEDAPALDGALGGLLHCEPGAEVELRGVWSARKIDVHFAQVALPSSFDDASPDATPALPIDLRQSHLATGAALAVERDGIALHTARKKWNFDLLFSLPESSSPWNALRVDAHVEHGRVAVALLGDAPEHRTLASTELWPTRDTIRRELRVPPGEEPKFLVVRNLAPDGADSSVTFRAVSLRAR